MIATSESGLSVLEVVAIYKDLSEVERGFRQLKDVLAMRPIYHQIESRVKAHIFVAALALLVQRLLARRLEEAGIDFSAERAMEALQTVRLVTFRMEDRPKRRGVSGGCPDARRVLKAIDVIRNKGYNSRMMTYATLQSDRREFLALTGLTLQEFQLLLNAFTPAYERRYPKDRTLADRPRQRCAGGGRKGVLDCPEQKLLYQVRKIRALLFHGLCRLGKIDWASEPHQELDRCLSRTITASKNFND